MVECHTLGLLSENYCCEVSLTYRPQVHPGTKGLSNRLPEDGSLIHVWVLKNVFLCAIERHELLVVLKLSCRPKVCQFVDGGAVNVYKLHDISWLEVTVH
ncbi:hypothetical protein E2C01_037828 [Portunus trituberculatus]|uniref:Uncharacterized protein n=1 Tax=Portunus trituberculatus TaxID=210409 RepID=A0A5B7FI90_PORTR|nr:hypothetical protein [Portunus trituberculatus]